MIIESENYKVEVNDSQEIKNKIFDELINFMKEQELFSGESIMQCDNGIIESPVFISKILDEILKPKVEYK